MLIYEHVLGIKLVVVVASVSSTGILCPPFNDCHTQTTQPADVFLKLKLQQACETIGQAKVAASPNIGRTMVDESEHD